MSDLSLRDKAAAFLAGDARVARFSIAETGGALDVTLTLSPAWVAAEREAAGAALETSVLQKWQMVYDRSYRWDRNVRAPNFDAWISGFTGELIPDTLMQIWLDDALALMRSVPHRRVIEIGCGVGLVVAALARGGESYHGLDLSGEAIASLAAWVATRPELTHVQLAQGAAHDVGALGLTPGDADLAVINSVVQYFPDARYLERVLAAVAPQLVEGGAIFLGDLRASALLPLRAMNIAAAQAGPGVAVAKVREDAFAALGLARELAIDPAFFAGLRGSLPRLGAITFSLKPEAADHELSGYRYDAILRLDVPRADPAPLGLAGSLDDMIARLDAARPPAICFSGIANRRLAGDVALARALAAAAPDTRLADLEIATDPAAVEPQALAAAAEACGYATELRFTPGSSEGRFDALLRRHDAEAAWPDVAPVGKPTNDPLGEDLARRLRRELQASLDTALGGRNRAKVIVDNDMA